MPARRHPALLVSLVAAFALNAVAVAAFAVVSAAWHSPSGTPTRTAWITAVEVAPAAPTMKKAVIEPSTRHTTAPSPSPSPSPSPAPTPTPEQMPPPPPAEVQAEAAPAAAPAAPGAVENEVRFYKSGEVERRAEPDSDWNLDTAFLDTAGIDKLVFDIFVNRDGEVVACKIIEPAALTDDLREALIERLRQTRLQPARRGDFPVASVQRIEVSVVAPGS